MTSDVIKTEADLEQYLQSPEHLERKREFDEWSRRVGLRADPIVEELSSLWKLLRFSPEAMAIQKGDPDIAFQVEWRDPATQQKWFIRMDYSSEIGDSYCYWLEGNEARAEKEFEYFAHGTPERFITNEEKQRYDWAFRNAIMSFVVARFIPADRLKHD